MWAHSGSQEWGSIGFPHLQSEPACLTPADLPWSPITCSFAPVLRVWLPSLLARVCMVPPLPHLNGSDACELHFCCETNWHGQGAKRSLSAEPLLWSLAPSLTGETPSIAGCKGLPLLKWAFCSVKYLMKACCRWGLRRPQNLSASLLKCTAPWLCNKELRCAGSAGWVFGAPGAVCSLLLVRLALTFPEPAARRGADPARGCLLLLCRSICGFVISRMKPSFLLSSLDLPGFTLEHLCSFTLTGRNSEAPCDGNLPFTILPNSV